MDKHVILSVASATATIQPAPLDINPMMNLTRTPTKDIKIKICQYVSLNVSVSKIICHSVYQMPMSKYFEILLIFKLRMPEIESYRASIESITFTTEWIKTCLYQNRTKELYLNQSQLMGNILFLVLK